MEQNTLYLITMIALVMSISAIIIAFLYLNKKYPDPSKKRDPIFTGFIIVLMLFAFAGLAELFGILPNGWVKNHLWIFGIAIVLVIGFYYFISKTGKPLPYNVLKEKALEWAYSEFKAEPYIGMADFFVLQYYGVDVSQQLNLPEDVRRLTGAVASFVIKLKKKNIFDLLIILNIYTGDPIKILPNYPAGVFETLKLKPAVNIYQPPYEEFRQEEEQSVKTEK